jgi:tetratricopeptide (TPR) repeat protein
LYRLATIERELGNKNEAQRWLNEARSYSACSSVQMGIARGLAYQDAGNAAAAVDEFTKLLKQAPTEAVAYLNRGWARLVLWDKTRSADDLRLADEDFAAASEETSVAASAFCGRAWVRFWQHQSGAATLDQAISFSRVALERDSNLAITHFVRGWILLAKGQPSAHEAKAAFQAALDLKHGVADTYSGLAQAERWLGNRDAAIGAYTHAITEASSSAANTWQYYEGRALTHAEISNWKSAYEDFRDALENAKTASISPSQYATLYADFGWSCYQLAHTDEMEEAFQKGLELDHDLVHLQWQLGGVRLYSGRYDDALACWERAIKLDPKSSEWYVNRGLTQIYKGDLAAALPDLDEAMRLNDKQSFVWHTRGWAWIRKGEWKRALRDLNKAIELSSDEPFSFHDRALARWWLGERTSALEDLHKNLDIQFSRRLGKFPRRSRENRTTWGATAEDWSRAMKHKPKDFVPYLGRGMAHWLAGELEAARKDLIRALSINRRLVDVQTLLQLVTEELATNGAQLIRK